MLNLCVQKVTLKLYPMSSVQVSHARKPPVGVCGGSSFSRFMFQINSIYMHTSVCELIFCFLFFFNACEFIEMCLSTFLDSAVQSLKVVHSTCSSVWAAMLVSYRELSHVAALPNHLQTHGKVTAPTQYQQEGFSSH